MPKIDAPTVAEHHANRRAAIVSAAVELLGDGPAAVTPAAVASAAGLARSSVYQYYGSTGALLGAAVEEMFSRALHTIDTAMARAGTPSERLLAYLDASLDAALAGHLPGAPVGRAEMPAECLDRVIELHAALVRPLVSALAESGCDEPDAVAVLVNGVVNAAAGQIQRGADAAAVRERVHRFVAAGVGAAR